MRVRVSTVALALVLSAAVEITVLVIVAHLIGFGPTLLLVLATSLLGGWLAKREGTRAWRRFRTVTATGERPGPQVTRALVGLIGALLLVLPGFVTDLIGLALFLPPVRVVAGRSLVDRFARRLAPSVVGDLLGPRRVRVKVGKPAREPAAAGVGGHPGTPTSATDAIEGEIVDER